MNVAPTPKWLKLRKGFTLAELLICLAIIGVIATFVIPKIMVGFQNQQNLSKAKEVAAMITSAFQKAQMDGIITGNTKPSDLTPYMNYVKYDTSGTVIDNTPTLSFSTCNSTSPCIILHNGGVLWFADNTTFTSSTVPLGGIIAFRFDPDYQNNTLSTADGPLKVIQFILYYDGFLTTRGLVRPGSWFGGPSTFDPSWFSF